MRPVTVNILITTFIFITVAAHQAHAGEVIHVDDNAPIKVQPKPAKSYNARLVPKYSDKAVLENVWVRAWVMLDVGATGKVEGFKYLKRPGYDLEPFAAREVWKLSFEPARDLRNRPVETQIVWRIEWPSFWWLVDLGTPLAWPAPIGLPATSPAMFVRCTGAGPSMNEVTRDCSMPDLKGGDHEKWIARPAGR
ncbi:MAG TPA: hypothetical protein VGG74_22245 [Kofleriaceae bacterium]|jgi:hypothetical protein